MDFFQQGVNDIGGEVKLTSASTSLNIFRKSFQKFKLVQEHYLLDKDKKQVKDFIFNAYYGGRTEVFRRGELYNLNYYDINSLYPSVMLNPLPNPNTVFIPDEVSEKNIICYEGVTYCYVQAPDDLNIPLLPYKDKNTGKLIFPLGQWYGHYNNIELREAIKLGYKITPYEQILYKKTFTPFKSFITNLYEKRLYYKSINSSMEMITKLIMNSLYGKFAQRKNTNVDIKVLNSLTQQDYEDILLYNTHYDVKEDIAIKTQEEEFNGVHSFPILSSYITSLARLKLYWYLSQYDVVYCDTDSIVTYDTLESSKELGEMKYEGHILKAEFFKPKMYYMEKSEYTDVKIKGVSKPTIHDIEKIKKGEIIKRDRISKIRGSVRSGINPNTVIDGSKLLSLEDNKRVWDNNISYPIKLNNTHKI
ncbi:MAG: DNA polymerase [bacterium]